jgi:Ni,Fe-hydrogenase III small subunit
VFEAERSDVACVYARIKRDPRHKDLALIVTGRSTRDNFRNGRRPISVHRNPQMEPCSVSQPICPPNPAEVARGLVSSMTGGSPIPSPARYRLIRFLVNQS